MGIFDFFSKPKYSEIDVAKEILGVKFPINATTFAKVATAEILRKKLEELFGTPLYSFIVLPNKNLNIEKLNKLIANTKCIVDNVFKGSFKYDNLMFDNNSITLCFVSDLKNFYEFASLIAKELNLECVLVYYSKSYQLKIIFPES